MSEIAKNTAYQVLDVVPLVMRTIRSEFRQRRSADLSVPQFRTLAYTQNNAGTSLSDLACHIGLTLPSMSKMVDGLVDRGLITREGHADDRRRICLKLTEPGKDKLDTANFQTQALIEEKLAGLGPAELETVSQAMMILKDLILI